MEDESAVAPGEWSLSAVFNSAESPMELASGLLDKGGIAIYVIAGLSVLMVALILWKLLRLVAIGAWRRARAERAVRLWLEGNRAAATERVATGNAACTKLVRTAIRTASHPAASQLQAEVETTRVAKRILDDAKSGLRGLELISTIAPLLGLFGTVLGMIAAFQALETAGADADPSALAGGIWEALLTTAAGMAVAIPAAAALTWFESVIARLQSDMEDMATRVLNSLPEERSVSPVASWHGKPVETEAAE